MKQTVTAGVMVPHPPIILPNIGRGEEKKIQDIADACQHAADAVVASQPDTILIVSPHAPSYFDYIQISDGPSGRGSMAQFRDPMDTFEIPYDRELIRETARICEEAGIPAGTLGQQDGSLDHGTMVPLYFLEEALKRAPGSTKQPQFVRIGIGGPNSRMHYRVGQAFAQAAQTLAKRSPLWDPATCPTARRKTPAMGSSPKDRPMMP
ncbi:class III extradiol dioxygenase subunit B-like domain-containing protein [Faecalibaculum rodentium]|uniref:class III extradiol dioxygenase subunit B-like domain-containing protein n=1 Tax=Faecalibaculum rodentium TaxID=1702221 RepID=UPI0030C7B0F2